jgi:uncharacterized protein (TIGR02271 family)
MASNIVVAAFTDETQAQKAMNDLMAAGFSGDQIRHSVRRDGMGLTDALTNLGLSDNEANFFNQEFENGRTIVSVTTDDRMDEARNILMQDGGYDFNTRMGSTSAYATSTQTTDYNQANYAQTAGTQTTDYSNQTSGYGTQNTGYTNQADYGTQTDVGDEERRRLRLREEQLQVNKQPVEAGEVGIHKDVVEEQKTVNVPVTHEEVYIERRPGSGQPTDESIGQGEDIRVPVREEQVNVTKQTVDTGEVAIGKRAVQETQQVSDTVKREEARIDREGDVNVQGTNIDNQYNQ